MRELPAGARLHLVTWQRLFQVLMNPHTHSLGWAVDLRDYLKLTGLNSFVSVRSGLAAAQEVRGLSDWSAPSPARAMTGLRQAAAIAAQGAPDYEAARLESSKYGHEFKGGEMSELTKEDFKAAVAAAISGVEHLYQK